MTDHKASRVISLYKLRQKIKTIIKILNEDKISLYAAESAFYIILSVVPFLILLYTTARMVVSDGVIEHLYSFAQHLPSAFRDFVTDEIKSLSERPTPAPFSLSALGVLWSSSRGIRAVRRGVRSVYGASDGTFFGEIIGGILLTAAFVILIAAVLVFIVFGNTLAEIISDAFPALHYLLDLLFTFSPVFFAVFLTMFFAFVLRAFTPENIKMNRYRFHLPGATLATIGWILYSYIFSLFITMFSDVSYVYGSLAALLILMIWLYMIMYILLLGAEFNKYIFMKTIRK